MEKRIDSLHYFHSSKGINVLKIHGGLNEFFQGDDKTGRKRMLFSMSDIHKMELFSSALEKIDELFIIGYSFGDKHINNRIVHAMHLNNQMRVCIVNPVYKQEAIFDPFDYGLRVRYCSAPFPIWADHERTGKWNSDFRRHIEKMTSELRNPFLSTIKSHILREL